jgi:glycerol-3-phosphate dehydrogenase
MQLVYSPCAIRAKRYCLQKYIVPTKESTLFFDKSFLPSDHALMIPKTSDGRVLFAVPWHDKIVVGTTDTLIKVIV